MHDGYQETETDRARDERAYEDAMEERDRIESRDAFSDAPAATKEAA